MDFDLRIVLSHIDNNFHIVRLYVLFEYDLAFGVVNASSVGRYHVYWDPEVIAKVAYVDVVPARGDNENDSLLVESFNYVSGVGSDFVVGCEKRAVQVRGDNFVF